MFKCKKIFLLLIAAIFMTGPASFSYGANTTDEATALVEKAISFLKTSGKDKMIAEISNNKGLFVKDDLYVFVLDMSGICLAHGGSKSLIGRDITKLKDYDGRYFIQDVVEGAKKKGSGWVDYHWANPTTKAWDKKNTYFKKDGTLIYCCGIYTK